MRPRDVHQQPPHLAPATLGKSPGTGALLEASRKYCTKFSCRNNDLIHNTTNQRFLYFLDEGLAIATAALANGRRQVVALYVPGDIINFEEIVFGCSFLEVSAINNAELARIAASDFARVLDIDYQYKRSFDRFVAYQTILAQKWLANIGQKNAVERTAHLLCELSCRLQASNAIYGCCMMPLNQRVLADMLGLSLVHLNRSLKHIRDAGLAVVSGRRLNIIDWEGLADLAEFDRSYLDVALVG